MRWRLTIATVRATRRANSGLVATMVGTAVWLATYLALMVLNNDDATDSYPALLLGSWPWLGITALFGALVGLLASMAWERLHD